EVLLALQDGGLYQPAHGLAEARREVPVGRLRGSRRPESVVEAGNGDPSGPVLELAEDARQRVERVRGDAAVAARVEVDRRAEGVQLDVENAPKAGDQGGPPGRGEAAGPAQDP